MSGRRILVTGATGGLGGALVAEFSRRGHRVVGSGRSPASAGALARAGAEFVAIDLAQPDADLARLLDGADSVVHAAALSASWGVRAEFEATNVDATRRLLAACGAARVRRFIFVSSPSIFAAFRDRPLIGEHDRPDHDGLNDYARTKIEGERLVFGSSSASMARCAIRPRALVGPGDRVILPRLAQLARRRVMPLPRGGRALIELTDMRDAAWAIAEAEERIERVDGTAINISGGRPIAVRSLATALAAALGQTSRLVTLPLAAARPLAAMLESLSKTAGLSHEPPLTRYTLATLAFTQTFDLEPARRLLGYAPQHDALETLLAEARLLAVRTAGA